MIKKNELQYFVQSSEKIDVTISLGLVINLVFSVVSKNLPIKVALTILGC